MDFTLSLGRSRSGRELRWCNASNPHISISGRSGSGKSYCLKRLMAQLPKQGVRCIVFDISDDFSNLSLLRRFAGEGVEITAADVRKEVVINPFQKLSMNERLQEEGRDVAARLSASLKELYHFPGDKQTMYLCDALANFLEETPHAWDLNEFISFVERDETRAKHMLTSLIRLKHLATMVHGGKEGYRWDLDTPGITIIRFDRIPDTISQAILTEFLLDDLWNRKVRAGADACPVVVVLDECQRLRFGEQSMPSRILREGRKFEFAGWFSSQWMDDKRTLSALGQAALQIHFHPDPTRARSLARMLSQGKTRETGEFEGALSSLKVGEFLYLDQRGNLVIARVET